MCTSLLLLYGSIGGGGGGGGGGERGGGGQKEHSQQRQQQVAVTASQQPESQKQLSTAAQRSPAGLPDRPLEGYISVLDHKDVPSHHQPLLASMNELTRRFWTLFK